MFYVKTGPLLAAPGVVGGLAVDGLSIIFLGRTATDAVLDKVFAAAAFIVVRLTDYFASSLFSSRIEVSVSIRS